MSARYYPIFLALAGKPVLVAGAGKVALRKAKGLVEAGARVTVVAPRIEADFERMQVELRRRKFRPADVRGAALVFAATDDRRANHAVAMAAKKHGIPVNVADAREECDFIVPARINRDGVQVAISTGGASPSLAAALRRKIEENL